MTTPGILIVFSNQPYIRQIIFSNVFFIQDFQRPLVMNGMTGWKLNSKKVFNNLLIYRTSGADIKSVTISINKEGCNDISYAPFALFGGSTFSTGTIGKIDNTLKTGNVTIKCNDNGSIQNVKFSNFPQYVNAVIIIYYENIKNAIVKEE